MIIAGSNHLVRCKLWLETDCLVGVDLVFTVSLLPFHYVWSIRSARKEKSSAHPFNSSLQEQPWVAPSSKFEGCLLMQILAGRTDNVLNLLDDGRKLDKPFASFLFLTSAQALLQRVIRG